MYTLYFKFIIFVLLTFYQLLRFFFFRPLDFSSEVKNLADKKNFELKGYAFTAEKESLRPARIVRVGLIQNQIILPTTAPVPQQVHSYNTYQ